jgi:hypothetical protein
MVEETGVPGENHRPVASHWQTLSYNVVSSTPRHERDLGILVRIVYIASNNNGADCLICVDVL